VTAQSTLASIPLAATADRFSGESGPSGGESGLVARAAVAAAAALTSKGTVHESAMDSRSQEALPLGVGSFG
jgi:hypothetical protein